MHIERKWGEVIMGEVIEASIASADRLMYIKLLNFLQDFADVEPEKYEIHIKDDWNNLNECNLYALSEIEEWIDTKIISIIGNAEAGTIGLYIEKDGQIYTYDFWLNQGNEIDDDKYSEFKKEVAELLEGMKMDLACVGREMFVDYSKGYDSAIEDSSGIDYIIASENVEKNYHISTTIKRKKSKPEYLVV